MTGIYDCFGYGSGYDVSFEERYKLIRKAGFDCVMLWWSNQFGRGDGYQEDVRLARSAGLFVENIHAPVHEQNNQHQLPFDSNINWNTVMEKIACTGYRGATTLEPMNWDYSHLNICQFLELAYERAKRLDDLRK